MKLASWPLRVIKGPAAILEILEMSVAIVPEFWL